MHRSHLLIALFVLALASMSMSISNDTDRNVDGRIRAEDRGFFGPIEILSTFMGIFDFIYSKVQPDDTSKILDTVTAMQGVLDAMDANIQKISSNINILQVAQYHEVEEAVQAALSDIRFNEKLPALEWQKKAENLYNKLFFFLGGMLNQNVVAPKILEVITEKTNCGGQSMQKAMEELMKLVSSGIAGLAFYSKKSPQIKGALRTQVLEGRRRDVWDLLHLAQWKCAEDASNKAVYAIISNVMQSSRGKSMQEVSDALHSRLTDRYMATGIKWTVFVYKRNNNDWYKNNWGYRETNYRVGTKEYFVNDEKTTGYSVLIIRHAADERGRSLACKANSVLSELNSMHKQLMLGFIRITLFDVSRKFMYNWGDYCSNDPKAVVVVRTTSTTAGVTTDPLYNTMAVAAPSPFCSYCNAVLTALFIGLKSDQIPNVNNDALCS